jgi:hypothetical protein
MPPVSMTPVVHLSLGISSRNLEKNQNYGINRGPEEDEGKIPRHCPCKKKTYIFTFYNPAYVYSSCEDKNITSGSLRHFSIEIINIKTRTIVYSTSFNKIGSVKD